MVAVGIRIVDQRHDDAGRIFLGASRSRRCCGSEEFVVPDEERSQIPRPRKSRCQEHVKSASHGSGMGLFWAHSLGLRRHLWVPRVGSSGWLATRAVSKRSRVMSSCSLYFCT